MFHFQKNEKLVKCPGCDLELPVSDWIAQNEHMRSEHPEIIIQRLRDANMHFEADKLENEIKDKK